MNTYIQDKLDSINIFDYIVFEYGDIDTEKSNEKLKKLLTDYHNHIVEKIVKDVDMTDQQLQDILSLLQDTNQKE